MHRAKSHANNKHHRYSWGSGHSSSSLHSSAATLGIGSGKDDLWAAIQTNYNYIMDTNLLDTCKEARCEIEGATSVLDNTADTCFKVSLKSCRGEVGMCFVVKGQHGCCLSWCCWIIWIVDCVCIYNAYFVLPTFRCFMMISPVLALAKIPKNYANGYVIWNTKWKVLRLCRKPPRCRVLNCKNI